MPSGGPPRPVARWCASPTGHPSHESLRVELETATTNHLHRAESLLGRHTLNFSAAETKSGAHEVNRCCVDDAAQVFPQFSPVGRRLGGTRSPVRSADPPRRRLSRSLLHVWCTKR